MAKFAAKLPNDYDRNGLETISRAFIKDPEGTALIVAVVDCQSITIETDTGAEIPTLRFHAVEGVSRESRAGRELLRIWQEAQDARTDKNTIPLGSVDDQ